MNDAMTFRPGVLGPHHALKGFRVIATDGPAGRVSWGNYDPGESYLVVTLGRISRKHHVVPAGAVTAVEDGEVRVALSRAQIRQLHDVPHPHFVADQTMGNEVLEHAFEAFARTTGV